MGPVFRFSQKNKSLRYLMSQKELNMQQRRWMNLIKDYNFVIKYHPRRGNIVADALSCKYKIVSNEVWDKKELLEVRKIKAILIKFNHFTSLNNTTLILIANLAIY